MTSAIKPFRIDVSDDILADLKSRLARTRWPEAELVGDWSQGASLKWIGRRSCLAYATPSDDEAPSSR
jgi:epoxide hydrolase